MSDRDELADVIRAVDGPATIGGLQLADALIAAGYRKPRTITTVAELDAAIIRCFEGGEPLTLRAKDGRPFILWEDEYGTVQVTSYPQEGDVNPLSTTDITLPAVTP